ncbi:MAG TPA: universal stress protein [Candidatus Binataceae bacterium]|nr:universal stress protein [Candidatus Binataceae bacterium]
MAYPYRRILAPIEFDETAQPVFDAAARIAAETGGTIFLMHVVPMVVAPSGMPNYVDIYKDQEKIAQQKLNAIVERQRSEVKCELLTRIGDPAHEILALERHMAADLIVLATHGRKGVRRMLLGSVAEAVLRDATCPVLTVQRQESDAHLVAKWMTPHPITAEPAEKLSAVHAKMLSGHFRTMPVLSGGKLVGVITDRDLRRHEGYLDHTEVRLAMSAEVATTTRSTPIHEAAQSLLEHKIGALPVVEGERLVGIISTSDVLRAFLETN